MQTDDTLVDFIKSLPLTNMKNAIRALVQYNHQNDFDTFIFDLVPNVDFTKISPLILLMSMARLPNTTEKIKEFDEQSCNYVGTLIQTPDIFCQNYDTTQLHTDFLNYLYSLQSEKDFSETFVIIHNTTTFHPDTINFFTKLLLCISDRFNASQMPECLKSLQIFWKFFKAQLIRINFFQLPNYGLILANLFSKSFFPHCQDFSQYFGNYQREAMTSAIFRKLNQDTTTYYSILSEILKPCFRTTTFDKTIKFLRDFKSIADHLSKQKVSNLNPPCFYSTPEMEEISREKIVQEYQYTLFSYMINFESVLMNISFLNQAQWTNLNPFTPYNDGSITTMNKVYPLAAFGEFSWLDESKLSLEDIKRNYKDKDEDIQADLNSWKKLYNEVKITAVDRKTSDIFFAAHDAINNGSRRLVDLLKNLDMILYSTKNEIVKEYLRIDRLIIPILLTIECRMNNMIELLLESLRFIVKTSGYNFFTKKLSERPPIAYQRLPEHMLLNSIEILITYFYLGRLNKNQLDEIIDLCSVLLSNKKFLRNPDTTRDIITLFANVSQAPANEEISFLVIKDTIIKQSFFPVVEFYSRVEKTGTRTGYQDKMPMRIACLKLIDFWLQYQICRGYYREHYQNQISQKFLYHVVRDLGNFIQDCFSNIEEIRHGNTLLSLTPMTEAEKVEYDKKVEEERKILKQKALEEIRLANQKAEKGEGKFLSEEDINIYKYRTPEEEQEHRIQSLRLQRKSDDEVLSSIKEQRRALKVEFEYVKQYFNLINTILTFAPRAFNEEKVAQDIVNIVVAVFLKTTKDDLTVENPYELEYDHNYFLPSCARFISMMTGNKTVMNKTLDPTFKLDDELCNKILDILEKMNKDHGSIYSNECNSFKYFIDTRNKMNVLILDPNVEIPDELCDPITYDLLTDPVLLPTGTVLNRTTLDRAIETGMKDPLTLATFDINEIKDAIEIKQKAEEFFKKHAIPIQK